MNAVDFPESNVVMAKDQLQYKPLPAHVGGDGRRITFCWRLTWRERFAVLLGSGLLGVRTKVVA